MLQFPDNYFEKEVRCDFEISSMMKRAWAAQLEVLDHIIRICKKHNITYYAFWGTLLGTIRHEGFIPWDDDMDIAFKREEYERFLEVAANELPEGYSVLNMYTEEEYDKGFSRIVNSKVIDISQKRLQEFHGCPFIVGIDIYPLDYIPRDAEKAQVQKSLLELISNTLTLMEYKDTLEEAHEEEEEVYEQVKEAVEASLDTLERQCGTKFTSHKRLENQLFYLYDRIAGQYKESESDMVAFFPSYMKRGNRFYPKEWFDEVIMMPFENIQIAVPSGYDGILTNMYRAYMVPRIVPSHDYPFYEEQLQMLVDRGMWKESE